MKNIRTYISIAAFSFLVMGLPAIASAQWGGYPNGNNYPNNGGYGNNNGYGNAQYAVRDLKQRAKSFERQTDNNGNYSNNGGWGNNNGGWGNNNGGWGNNRNNNGSSIEDLADDFSKAASRLEDKYGRGRNLNNSYNEAQRVLQLGSQLDRELRRMRSSNNLRNEWNQIDNDLRIIASEYNISYNSGRNGGWGNGGGRGNGRGNNMPSWWPF